MPYVGSQGWQIRFPKIIEPPSDVNPISNARDPLSFRTNSRMTGASPCKARIYSMHTQAPRVPLTKHVRVSTGRSVYVTCECLVPFMPKLLNPPKAQESQTLNLYRTL